MFFIQSLNRANVVGGIVTVASGALVIGASIASIVLATPLMVAAATVISIAGSAFLSLSAMNLLLNNTAEKGSFFQGKKATGSQFFKGYAKVFEFFQKLCFSPNSV